MKVYLDCLLCFLPQALDTARRVTGDKRTQCELLGKVAFATPGFPLDTTPIELGRKVCRIVREVTGIDDPYREAKQGANDRATVLLRSDVYYAQAGCGGNQNRSGRNDGAHRDKDLRKASQQMMPKKGSEEELRKQREQAEQAIEQAMDRIGYRIVVFSGKGGVGKTTVAVNLACVLARRGSQVGLLDADVTGPNVPQMIGIDEPPQADGDHLLPHERYGIKIVSLASMLPFGAPVIWRGPMRSKALEQLLGETQWGDLNVLIVDLPPGTGDEVLTIAQRTSPQIAIVVTTPQEVALLDARRAINFAKKLEIPTIGIVENMSGLVCPHCGGRIELFGTGGGRREADRQDITFLGAIPIDPATREGGDTGRPIVLVDPISAVSKAFEGIASHVERLVSSSDPAASPEP